jgi:DNA-binding YbaB/EbfC family protein
MDLFKMLGQFKDIQGRMQTMQEEMSQRTFSALSGGGMVTADVDGKMQLKRIKLDPTVVNPGDIEMLEDLIVVAVAEAQKKAADAMQMELQKVTGGIDLPFKLPF